jgi:hypothetical protein
MKVAQLSLSRAAGRVGRKIGGYYGLRLGGGWGVCGWRGATGPPDPNATLQPGLALLFHLDGSTVAGASPRGVVIDNGGLAWPTAVC